MGHLRLPVLLVREAEALRILQLILARPHLLTLSNLNIAQQNRPQLVSMLNDLIAQNDLDAVSAMNQNQKKARNIIAVQGKRKRRIERGVAGATRTQQVRRNADAADDRPAAEHANLRKMTLCASCRSMHASFV